MNLLLQLKKVYKNKYYTYRNIKGPNLIPGVLLNILISYKELIVKCHRQLCQMLHLNAYKRSFLICFLISSFLFLMESSDTVDAWGTVALHSLLYLQLLSGEFKSSNGCVHACKVGNKDRQGEIAQDDIQARSDRVHTYTNGTLINH